MCVLEQAKYPGGCASSYKSKGYWFENGSTTLVGQDDGMPLRYLFDATGIQVPCRCSHWSLLRVHLQNGDVLTRYKDLHDWIAEAERVFRKHNQRLFWEHCCATRCQAMGTGRRVGGKHQHACAAPTAVFFTEQAGD